VMQHRAKVRIKCTYVGPRVYRSDARRHQDRQVSVFRRCGSGQGVGPHYDAGFLTFVRECLSQSSERD